MIFYSLRLVQDMKFQTALFIFCFLLSTLFIQPFAYSFPTKWEEIEVSMSSLLNSGWQLTAHGTNRVAANSNSGNSFDVASFTFILSKDKKYILCIVESPRPPVANVVGCRKLN
jgi:hypothetical protein